jgi:four helix bundle protein
MLTLKHKQLDVYILSRELLTQSYSLTDRFPTSEKFGLTMQIRRAATSVKLNIAEGASRSSLTERRRFFEISRGSLIEVDAGFETAVDLNYIHPSQLEHLEKILTRVFGMLSKLVCR